MNDTQANILSLLQLKEENNVKSDGGLFPQAINIFRQIPAASNPCRKLYLLSASIAMAIHEMRQMYSERNPEVEIKVKVPLEMVLSVLIYIIINF